MTRNIKIAIVASLLLGTAACAGGGNILSGQDTAAVQQFLQKTVVAREAALDAAYNDFAAATPQQTHGMACVGSYPDPTKPIDNVGLTNVGTGARSVLEAVKREIAANPPGNGVSPEEAIAKASIYEPGSNQFNWVITQVETGCTAYLHDINQATNSVNGIFSSAALQGILAGAPMGVQARPMTRYAAGAWVR